MKVFKSKTIVALAMILTSSVAITAVLLNDKSSIRLKGTGGEPYVIALNGNNSIYSGDTYTSSDEVSGNITTTIGNTIQLNAYKVISNDNGWQSILPGGYFYNPVLNSVQTNKIKGLSSISYVGNGSLELHYGWTLDNEKIIYSTEETLASGTTYTFSQSPSYLYLKNTSNSTVNINSLNLSYSCSETEYPNANLKVLMIGNSFADDTVFYSKRVAASYGINLDIYDAYIAGCTISTHYTNIQDDSIKTYSMRSTSGTSWVYSNNMSLTEIINSHTWDVITFQQASAEIGRPDSYNNLSNLVSSVRSLVGSTPKFYWYQTWAYDKDYMEYYDYFSYFNNDQTTMYNAIISCYNSKVAPLNVFEDIIAAGTAVQNMRTTYMLDNITRDGKHMSEVHGRYLLACNFVSKLLNIDLDLSPVSYLDSSINSSYQDLVYESVRNARKHPLQVTASTFINWEISNYDLSNYTEIDPELVGCSYYNSTDNSNWDIRIGHTKDKSNLYVSSKIFTRSTLPVGSLVFLKEGFGYIAEGWKNFDQPTATRPSERYENVLEITSSFWPSKYEYRGFSFFKSGKSDLTGRFNQVFDSVKFFVPTNLAAGLKTKDDNNHYSDDSVLFNNNGKNINNYKRLHLDPIFGYYKCDSNYELKNSYYVDATAMKFVCTRPFYKVNGDLPAGTVIIVDSGWQWRSDCWTDHGTNSNRPNNETTPFKVLDAAFMNNYRVRTFNVSNTDNTTQCLDEAIEFMDHMRIYVPLS